MIQYPKAISINDEEAIEYPMTAHKAVKKYMDILSDYEKGEVFHYENIYYVGEKAQNKINAICTEENNGFDDEGGDYRFVIGDHISYRYEILSKLGSGSFGQAIECFDHKLKQKVAVKIIKNCKKFEYQAKVEVEILEYLRDHDPNDKFNIIRMKEKMKFRNHLCLSFELLSVNLYDFLKQGDFKGLSINLIRRIAIQILYALSYTKSHNIIHCDLKPENVILKN